MGRLRQPMVAAVLAVGACADPSTYACSSDAQCILGGEQGYCEPTGYCSFDDALCDSGRRYGNLAPNEIAGECTLPGDEPTGSGPTTTPTTSISGDDGSSSTSTTQSPTTTMPIDPATSSESSSGVETTGAETDAVTSSTGGPIEVTCTPTVSDEFDDDELDPLWDTWASAGCSFVETSGQMDFTVAPSDTEWISAGISNGPAPIVGGYVRAELIPFEAPLGFIGVWLSLYNEDECELQIAAENSIVRGRVDQTWFDGPEVALDEPLWLQLRVDLEGVAYWEYSTDGMMTWVLMHSEPSPCVLDSVNSAIFAGGTHEGDDITRSVGYYERCDPI